MSFSAFLWFFDLYVGPAPVGSCVGAGIYVFCFVLFSCHGCVGDGFELSLSPQQPTAAVVIVLAVGRPAVV